METVLERCDAPEIGLKSQRSILGNLRSLSLLLKAMFLKPTSTGVQKTSLIAGGNSAIALVGWVDEGNTITSLRKCWIV